MVYVWMSSDFSLLCMVSGELTFLYMFRFGELWPYGSNSATSFSSQRIVHLYCSR